MRRTIHTPLHRESTTLSIILIQACLPLQPIVLGQAECLEPIQPIASEEMNRMLLQDFTNSEVEEAIFNMNSLSSPGPDGFLVGFYQQQWNIIGQNICDAVLSALNNNIWPSNINETFIVLIPKTKHPSKVSEFRSISL